MPSSSNISFWILVWDSYERFRALNRFLSSGLEGYFPSTLSNFASIEITLSSEVKMTMSGFTLKHHLKRAALRNSWLPFSDSSPLRNILSNCSTSSNCVIDQLDGDWI